MSDAVFHVARARPRHTPVKQLVVVARKSALCMLFAHGEHLDVAHRFEKGGLGDRGASVSILQLLGCLVLPISHGLSCSPTCRWIDTLFRRQG